MMSKTALIFATTAAIALGGFELRPAAAAPEGGPAAIKQGTADDFSSQRKRRRGRGVHPGVPLAAFGALIGTIGAVAAAQRQRDYYYERPYYYAEPEYVAPQSYYYAQPQPYVRHHYAPPPQAYRHHGGHHGPRHHGHAAPAPSAPVYNNPGLGDGRM
jgi:hypothetical protein